jgi:WD40 repeat protein
MSFPIRLLGQLGIKNQEILRKMFPHLQHQKFTGIDDFYELLISYQTYWKMMANCSMKIFLCHRLMRRSTQNFVPKYNFFMAMMNRIYRFLNPIPDSGNLVPQLINCHSFNRQCVNSIKFHEIYPVMANTSSVLTLWRIKDDNTFEQFSALDTSSNALSFHPKLPILVASLESGFGQVILVKFNIDCSNAVICKTIPIKKGCIWSIVFHPTEPVVYVSCDYGFLGVLKFTPDFSDLQDLSLINLHRSTINGLAIQRKGRFIAACSDDCTASISTFTSADCTKVTPRAVLNSTRKILSISIHPTLDLVAIGSDNQTASVWRIDEDFQKTCIKTFSHWNGVRCVQFDWYNWTLITGCYDGHVQIWNLKGEDQLTRIPIHRFKKPSERSSSVLSVGLSPNRPRVIAIGDWQEITICKLEELKN